MKLRRQLPREIMFFFAIDDVMGKHRGSNRKEIHADTYLLPLFNKPCFIRKLPLLFRKRTETLTVLGSILLVYNLMSPL